MNETVLKSRFGCLTSVIGLAILLVFVFTMPAERTTASNLYLFLFVTYGFIVAGLRIWHPTPWLPSIAFLLLSVGGILYYRYETAEGILASHGVHFDPNAANYESVSLNKIKFWFANNKGTLPGPEMTGDLLYVEKPFQTREGHLEFIVRSRVYPHRNYVRIELLSPPVGNVAFRVAEQSFLSVFYPLQPGLKCAP